jgi:hypothetical protein
MEQFWLPLNFRGSRLSSGATVGFDGLNLLGLFRSLLSDVGRAHGWDMLCNRRVPPQKLRLVQTQRAVFSWLPRRQVNLGRFVWGAGEVPCWPMGWTSRILIMKISVVPKASSWNLIIHVNASHIQMSLPTIEASSIEAFSNRVFGWGTILIRGASWTMPGATPLKTIWKCRPR